MSNSPVSRRERQILDVLYRCGRATAAEVQRELPDSPSYSAVRATLRILEEKGHVRHEEQGPRYVYLPTVSRELARQSAMRQLMETFFHGSPAQAVVAMLDESASRISPDELDRLAQLIEQARKRGKP